MKSEEVVENRLRFFPYFFTFTSYLLLRRTLFGWSVWMDSNHRPHAYQACALTTWATNRFSRSLGIGSSIALSFTSLSLLVKSEKWIVNSEEVIFPLGRLVEMMGFEPMTPCLQGRCSPSWATPPYHTGFFLKDHCESLRFWSLKIEQQKFHTSSLKTSLVKSTPRSPWKDLMVSIERRWSSRTFRYGYLVTT